MRPFTTLTSRMAPLANANVDTDQIIPASYLKVTDRSGLGEGLFARWRQRADGSPNADFVLNQDAHAGAEILIAGDNFGCGSSREHAPWALLDYGFRAVLSTRFADIFAANSLKNGLLLVTLPTDAHGRLMETASRTPDAKVTIELEPQEVLTPWGDRVGFEIDPFAKHCLTLGVDQLGFLLQAASAVDAYEASHPPRIDASR